MDETIAQNSQIKWTVYYEEEFTMNPSPEKIRDDLNYLRMVGAQEILIFDSFVRFVIY
jgi:hypothetical protein